MYALGNAKAYNTLRPRKGLANPFAGIKMESEIEPVLARLSSPDKLDLLGVFVGATAADTYGRNGFASASG